MEQRTCFNLARLVGHAMATNMWSRKEPFQPGTPFVGRLEVETQSRDHSNLAATKGKIWSGTEPSQPSTPFVGCLRARLEQAARGHSAYRTFCGNLAGLLWATLG